MKTVSMSAMLALFASFPAVAENAAMPLGEPVLEAPTLHSLGVYWIVRGDDNRNATIEMECRGKGAKQATRCLPLFRVEKGAHKTPEHGTRLDVPADGWLFAGSALRLEPGTAYEIRLTLRDPDGGAAEKTLSAKTALEPAWRPTDGQVLHAAPGGGGGNGSQGNPFKGLAAAQKAAKPGTLILLQPGMYAGTFTVDRSGEPGKPIVWQGPADGSAILEGVEQGGKRAGRVISATGVHDVWFDRLTVQQADFGIVAHDSQRIVVRRCRIRQCEYGFTCSRNADGQMNGFFLTDNEMEGPSTWPRTKGIENARGIQITGTGHVVAYNRIRGYADAIDTFPSPVCAAIDVHNNDLDTLTDDGIEMDYSERNTRCFDNRLTNVFQGISVQPVHGGPVYIFRNAMYNVCGEPFKMHNNPSGVLFFHNTCVKKGAALTVMTSDRVRNSVMRNNLFVGSDDRYAVCFESPMEQCDFDFDGFAMTGKFERFLKWNDVRYADVQEMKARAPVYRNARSLDPKTLFASPAAVPPADETRHCAVVDLRLRPDAQAVDAGQPLPGINDGFAGKAPDLGAYEVGADLPHYGPRPLPEGEKK